MLVLFTPVLVQAQEPAGSIAFGDHYYQLVTPSGSSVTWAAASSDASNSSFAKDGTEYRGYLATIASASENAAIGSLFTAPEAMAWIGGYQLPEATSADEGWRWVNNDGEIPGENGAAQYANWAVGEPTNTVIPGSAENTLLGLTERDYLAYDGQSGDWYAATLEGLNGKIPAAPVTAYVIEYEAVVPEPVEEVGVITDPQSCKENEGSGQGCNTIPEHRLILPASAEIPDGATIVYRAWTFDDARVNEDAECETRMPLDPFATFVPDEPELHGDLVLQEYLCGSPRFTVVRTFAPAITITTDTVKSIHEKLDGNLFECDPAALPPTDPGYRGIADPQFRDRAVWRSTRHTAIESTYNTVYFPAIGENWEGNASERTNQCGSSEADTEEKSYFVLGLHIDFGPPYGNADATFENFVLLTRYKLLRLRDNVEIAEDDIEDDSDVQKLRKKVEDAIEELDKDHYDHALDDTEKFLKELENTDFDENYDEHNRYGELKSRGLNIAHTLDQLVIPFEP